MSEKNVKKTALVVFVVLISAALIISAAFFISRDNNKTYRGTFIHNTVNTKPKAVYL